MRRTGTGSRETWSLEKLSQGIKVRDKSGWSSFSVTFKLGRDGVCVCVCVGRGRQRRSCEGSVGLERQGHILILLPLKEEEDMNRPGGIRAQGPLRSGQRGFAAPRAHNGTVKLHTNTLHCTHAEAHTKLIRSGFCLASGTRVNRNRSQCVLWFTGRGVCVC